MKVYIVIATKGEYSDRSQWVAAVYLNREEAIYETERRGALAREAALAWNNYVDAKILCKQLIAPPPPEPEVDDYTVVAAPIGGIWGEWDSLD